MSSLAEFQKTFANTNKANAEKVIKAAQQDGPPVGEYAGQCTNVTGKEYIAKDGQVYGSVTAEINITTAVGGPQAASQKGKKFFHTFRLGPNESGESIDAQVLSRIVKKLRPNQPVPSTDAELAAAFADGAKGKSFSFTREASRDGQYVNTKKFGPVTT